MNQPRNLNANIHWLTNEFSYFVYYYLFWLLLGWEASKTGQNLIKSCKFQHNSPYFKTIQHKIPQLFETPHKSYTNEIQVS
jgi:hypothetical protein